MDPHTLHRGTCLSVKSPVSFWEGSEDDGENEEQSCLAKGDNRESTTTTIVTGTTALPSHIIVAKHVVVPLHWLGSL
jgi:hypothetical protein